MRKIFSLSLTFTAGLFLFFMMGSSVSAEGESTANYPEPSLASNYANYGGTVSGNLLYLSVGYGEHISGTTSTEVYPSSGGTVSLLIIEATTCYRNQPGANPSSVDIPPGAVYYFYTNYRVIDATTGDLMASLPLVGYDCGNQNRSINFVAVAGGKYRLEAQVTQSNFSGENLYRLRVDSGNATLGLAPTSVGGVSFTNRDLLPGYESSYSAYFATACSGATISAGGLVFYDADYGIYQSRSERGYPDLVASIDARPRGSTGAWTVVGSKVLTGGNGQSDSFSSISFPPNTEYRLRFDNLTRPNALEVLLDGSFTQQGNGKSCAPPECIISDIVTFNGDRSTILPGERIKFNATVSGASGYRIGVNGSGYGNEYGGTDIKNYLVSGTAYARGPTFSSDASTSVTVSALGYSDSASVTQAFSAPTAAGSYDFSWGLVRSGIGWKPVTCSGTLRVTDKPDDPPPPPNMSCPSYPPYASFNNPNVTATLPPGGKPNNQAVPTAPPPGSWTATRRDTISPNGLNRTRTYVDTSSGNIVYSYGYSNQQPITDVISIFDQWTQAVVWATASEGDGTVEMNYTSLMSHPYDLHNPTITYRYKVFRRSNNYTYTRTRTYYDTRPKTSADWTLGSGSNNGWSSSRANYTDGNPYWGSNVTAAAAQMPPCFPRRYSATPAITGAVLNTNRENPTSATVTFTIPTVLSFTDGGTGLRTPTTVTGLGYRVDWQARGYSTTAAGFSGTYSGTVNIVNPLGSPANLGNNITGLAGTTGTLTRTTQSFTVPANMQAGDQVCFTVTVGEAVGRVKIGGERWLPGNTPRTTGVTCSGMIVDQPYTRFYGADVSAGGGFNTSAGLGSCSAVNTFASAFGPMRSDIFAGSGAQLAVFAIDVIQGIQPLSRSTRTPTQLAFSNTTPTPNIDSRKFGGSFGSKLCAHNYFGDVPENAPWVAANVNLGSLEANDTDRYYRAGNINLTGLLPDGRRAVIYVNGNVTIKDPVGGKVGFATSTYEWGSIDQVPSLYIIASGNINVNNDVTRLDGTFISQGGEIHSCAVNGNYPTISQLTEQCRTQLVVNGAFIANKVNLLRTLGSLRESYSVEVPTSDPTPNDPAPTTPASSRAAEIFIFNPTQWLTNGGGLPSNSKMQIDSYTSLPPSL